MKSIGLDTTVLLRLLTGEPESQATAARKFVEECMGKGITMLVSDLVIAEAYHALVYHYDVPKRSAARALHDLFLTPMMVSSGEALAILANYTGAGPGLVDRIIAANLLESADAVATFDKDFARLSRVRLIG